jgi:hypothetical protein
VRVATPKEDPRTEIRSAASIGAQMDAYQDKVMKLLAAGKKTEALKAQIQSAKDQAKEMLDLPYQGKNVGDVEEFKDAKKVTDVLIQRVWDQYKLPSVSHLQGLIGFSQKDFRIPLFQMYDVAGVFNNSSAGMDLRLKTWFVLGFYGYAYELGGKLLLSYVNVFPKTKPLLKVGEAVDLLQFRHKIKETPDYFDHFLRNSIDH